jgi:hypothetical protein
MAPPIRSRGGKALSVFLDSLRLLEGISEAAGVPVIKGAIGIALRIGEVVVVRIWIILRCSGSILHEVA